jgi:hypothetical protein
MQRARRLASTAVVAVLGVGALSACRAEPDVAAYVGVDKITEAQVNAVYSDAEKKLATAVEQVRAQQKAAPDPSAQPVPDKVELQFTRQDVLTTLVGVDVFKQLAQQRNVQLADQPAAQVAQAVGLPQDAQYVALYGQYRGYIDAFTKAAKPATVTEADLRDVYDRLKAGGGLGSEGGSFEDFSKGLSAENQKLIKDNVSVRNDLTPDLNKIETKVNPRYGALEIGLVNFRSEAGKTLPLVLLSLVKSGASPAVVDRS